MDAVSAVGQPEILGPRGSTIARVFRRSAARSASSALLVLLFFTTIPPLAESPDVGLDPSWKMGMQMAREQGLVLGRDLFFTYGPWGFLSIPLTLVRPLWLAAFGYGLAVQVALFAALGLWVRRSLGAWKGCVAPLALALFAPAPEYHLVLALVLWVHLAVTFQAERKVRAVQVGTALIGAAGAATSMIKFSTGLAAALVIAGGILAALRLGRRQAALALGAGFCLGGFAGGVASLGSPGALGRFLSVSWRIAASYNDAFQRTGPAWQPWLMASAVCLIALGIAAPSRNHKESLRDLLPLILPAIGLFALSCKHAFGRQETHVFYAFSIGATLATWILLALPGQGRMLGRGLCLLGTAVLAAGTLVLSPPARLLSLPGVPGARVTEVAEAAIATGDPAYRSRLRQDLRRLLPLGESVQNEVRGRSVDVLTVEIALVEAWGLRWTPRRILQSPIVSSASLDAMDADWFSGRSAPERLLVDMQGLDTRHPFMDSPLAWRQVLLRYEPLGQDRRWLVLGLRDHPRSVVATPLKRYIAPLNQPISAPQPAAGHLEMSVVLEPSLLGRLASIPWLVPEVRLGIVSSSRRQPLRRILATTAMNSFPLLDPWPDTPADLRSAFTDAHAAAPGAVGFVTPSPWAWKNEVDVTFYQVEWSTDGSRAETARAISQPGQPHR